MITDQTILASLREQWAVVTRFCESSHRQYQIPGGPFINETHTESFYNLPLFLAYGVLDQVLAELLNQGIFQCAKKGWSLGQKMVASKDHLPWQNYDDVEKGKTARNDLAHQAKLVPKVKCFEFIDAIGVELKAWHILL